MKRKDYDLIGCGFRIKKVSKAMYRVEYLRRKEEQLFVLYYTLGGLWANGLSFLKYAIKERLNGGER